jgi:Ca-activated chloride channel family protein
MKQPLLVAALLFLGWRAEAQTQPNSGSHLTPPNAIGPASPSASSPTEAPLGLVVLDSKGQIQAVCPLQRTDVSADISGTVARVTVTQRFSNPSKTPIEALYTFPLPHDAAVDAMNFRIGARQIIGQIKKREEAAQIYQEARAAGRNAALLDQERPNIFSQRVANIVPGQQISVEISFVQPVSYRAGSYQWEFPTVVGPRFVPSGGYQKPGERGAPASGAAATGGKTPGTDAVVSDPEKITPPITPQGQRAGHDLTMKVRLQSALPLGAISAALHPISVQKVNAQTALISLREGASVPNKDFVLRFGSRDGGLQSGVLTRSQGAGGFFQLVLQPPPSSAPAEVSPKEMVFVIDQTGSQRGLPIQKAKETMRYCIQNLNPGDTFQLLGFTTQVNPCFERPVAATPENIAKAKSFLDGIDANGGTDILKAASYVLKLPADPAKPRIVCFMTDGYVGNDAQIIDFVRQNRGAARMFPFGIGNSVNRNLIDGMAREGRGVAEYALLNEDGEKLAQRFYDRVAKPVLLDVKADWGTLPVADVFPKVIPDVFESGPVVLTGRFTRPSNGQITLRGLAGGKPWQQNVPVDFPAEDRAGGEGLPSLWARAKIEDLSNRSVPDAPSGETAEDLKEQITAVALEFRLMSQYTSFVAVEPKVVNVGGVQKTVDVPVEMPDGVSYDGIFARDSRGVVHSYAGGVARMPMLGSVFSSPRALGGGGAFGGSVGGGGGFGGSGSGVSGFGGGIPSPANRMNALEARPMSAMTAPELAAMKPEERLAWIRQHKMAPQLPLLLARFAKEAKKGSLKIEGLPEVTAGRLTLQIWLAPLANSTAKKAFAAQLKALGWREGAILQAEKLVIGTLDIAKLDELAALEGVRIVDVPRFSAKS